MSTPVAPRPPSRCLVTEQRDSKHYTALCMQTERILSVEITPEAVRQGFGSYRRQGSIVGRRINCVVRPATATFGPATSSIAPAKYTPGTNPKVDSVVHDHAGSAPTDHTSRAGPSQGFEWIGEFQSFVDAMAITSTALLTGTISHVECRHAFVYSPLMDQEAVIAPGVLDELVPQPEWIGSTVAFKLKPTSLFAQECHWYDKQTENVRPGVLRREHGQGGVTEIKLENLSVSGRTGNVAFSADTEGNIGTWTVAGNTPTGHFFHPELSIRTVDGVVELTNNTPPMVNQNSITEIQFWAFWLLTGAEVSLSVIDEDGDDVTGLVCSVNRVTPPPGIIMLDQLVPQIVYNLVISWKEFDMEATCCELTLRLRISRDVEDVVLTSKPLFVRSALTAARSSLMDKSAPAHKYWATDCIGPEDRIVDGFTDPGRANALMTVKQYDDIPPSEREVIVVEQSDAALQRILAEAKDCAGRIIDTYLRARMLMLIVHSVLGGSGVTELRTKGALRQAMGPALAQTSTAPEQQAGRKGAASRKRQRKVDEPTVAAEVGVVRLGHVQHGVCRHRALLFKYLCDATSVPCFLMRGSHVDTTSGEEERHTWNVVVVDAERLMLFDSMLSPTHPLPWPSPEYRCQTAVEAKALDYTGLYLMRMAQSRLCVGEEFGRGASAIVRKITSGGTAMAIKTARTDDDLQTLFEEYKCLQIFRSSNFIVQALGWRRGILMELLPMSLLGFLNQMLLRKQVMSYAQQRSVLRCVASALRDVHAAGRVHRDVKAENVLLSVIRCRSCSQLGIICPACDLRAKLADFADCVPLGRNMVIHPTGLVGTVPYAAPEVEAQVPYTCVADNWSLGILAVEMANMQLPLPDRCTFEPVPCPYLGGNRKVLVPLLSARSEKPPWLSGLLGLTLQVDMKRRASAAEIVVFLGQNS